MKLYPLPSTLYPAQKGLSSLVLMFMLVLGVLIIWEINEYLRLFINPVTTQNSSPAPDGPTERFCATGEDGNCNDSNDQFLFNG